VKLVKMFAVITVVATLLCISPLSVIADDYKNQILALEMKYDQLEAQQKQIQTQIDKAKPKRINSWPPKISWIIRSTAFASR